MKKGLLLLAMLVAVFAAASVVNADDDANNDPSLGECKCGIDQNTGECLPCPDDDISDD